jgi:cytochrome P450
MTTGTTPLPFLDTLDPGFDPAGPQVRAAREEHWCARTPVGLAVLRHAPVSALLSDRRLVQGTHHVLTSQGLTEAPLVEWMNAIILTVEGADHTRLRRLYNKAFTPRAVEALRPLMRRVANELVDRFVDSGRVDIMAEFADPYPARIICELIGVPAQWHERFRGWANDLGLAFTYTAAANLERIESALAGLNTATAQLITAHRDNPGDDLLSALIAAESDGDRLSPAELQVTLTGLLFAGQDTTRHQLGRTLELFEAHPDQWALLAQRPDLAAAAVEEGLRCAPSTTATARIAATDLEVDGMHIPAGTFLTMVLASANTDPAAFGPDADRFDITTTRPATALTFGAGIHHCLGSVLARIEMAEALTVLAQRLGPIALDGEPGHRPALGITGPVSLPVRFGRMASTAGGSWR